MAETKKAETDDSSPYVDALEAYELASRLLREGDEEVWESGGTLLVLDNEYMTPQFSGWFTPSRSNDGSYTITLLGEVSTPEMMPCPVIRRGTFNFVEGEWHVQGEIERMGEGR